MHSNYLPLILLYQKLNTSTDYGSMQWFFLDNLNSFYKEFYTCICNITKKLSFLVKILYNVTLTKD